MTAALMPSSTAMMAVNNRIVATVSICGFREPKVARARSDMRVATRRIGTLVCGLTGEVRAWVISDIVELHSPPPRNPGRGCRGADGFESQQPHKWRPPRKNAR